MVTKCSWLVVLLCWCPAILSTSLDKRVLVKRMDLETCIHRFDVQYDMIIRTKESQKMGAEALDNADLGSREECLRLCCETDECDVFVFEEKTAHCFLFKCGPSANFRCKFTKHSNYTSAVLRTSVVQAPASTTTTTTAAPKDYTKPGLSQHELELANLRKPNQNGLPVKAQPITTLIPPLGVRLADNLTTKPSAIQPTSACSRFQFQCHSGECIAVYNACDGIPQCEDASDEGPECPPSNVNKPYVDTLTRSSNSRSRMGQNVLPEDALPSVKFQNMGIIPKAYTPQMHNREDPMSVPQKWMPRPNNDLMSYPESDSHIFNHKGGLQIADNPMDAYQNNYIQSRDPYVQQLPDSYRIPSVQQQMMQQQQEHRMQVLQQQQQQQQEQQQPPPPPPQILPAQRWPQMSPPDQLAAQSSQTDLTVLKTQKTAQQNFNWAKPPPPPAPSAVDTQDAAAVIATKSPLHVAVDKTEKPDASGSEDEEQDYEDDVKVTEPPPRKKGHKHKKQSKGVNKNEDGGKAKGSDDHQNNTPQREHLKMFKNELEMEFADHDGAADTPSGAVLSLTLGIIVTVALALLIVFRMRAVGRRVRRIGKSPYAHDADFLVNGMYL